MKGIRTFFVVSMLLAFYLVIRFVVLFIILWLVFLPFGGVIDGVEFSWKIVVAFWAGIIVLKIIMASIKK